MTRPSNRAFGGTALSPGRWLAYGRCMSTRAVRIVGALVLTLVLGSGAMAGEPRSPRPAERLHDAAVGAYRAGRLRQAIELWRDALRLEPVWKYAYNLANTLYEADDGLEAWQALKQAEALSPPEKYLGQVVELGTKVRALLYKDHALLVLTVALEGAAAPDGVPRDPPVGWVVKRDGAPWDAPFEAWVAAPETVIEVAAPGFVPRREVVKTPVGERVALTIALAPVPAAPVVGVLAVDYRPHGARVIVAGVERGVTPLMLELPPGEIDITIAAAGFVERMVTGRVAAGAETRLEGELAPVVVPEVGPSLALPGWTSLIGGGVLVGLGVGALVWADDTRDDLRALNADPGTDFDVYSRRYDSLEGAFEDRRLASQVLIVGGGLAVVGGVVMLLLDDGAPAPRESLRLVPVPGGAALLGGASF